MGKKIHIEDEGMRRALDYHGIDVVDEMVDPDHLERLDSFDWGSTGIGEHDPDLFHSIDTLEGLEHAKKLKTVGLNGHGFETLAPFANLNDLEELWIHDNCLKDISAVKGKKKLRILDLSMNRQLEDISAVRSLPNLEMLQVGTTKVKDITVFDTLPNLRVARFWYLEFERDTPNWETLLNLMERNVQVFVDHKYREQLAKDLATRKLKNAAAGDELGQRLTELELTDLALMWSEGKEKAEDKKGNNLLHLLVQKELPTDLLLSLIDEFTDQGVDINKRNSEWNNATPLTMAMTKKQDLTVIEKLVEKKASLNLPHKHPPIKVALEGMKYGKDTEVYKKNKAYLDFLLQGGADLTEPGSFAAICRRAPLDMVKLAISNGADANGEFDNWTHLGLAAFAERGDVVKLLLSAGADSNKLDDVQQNPLFRARNKECFDLLIDAGANPLIRSRFGETPLFQIGDWGVENEEACKEAIAVAEKLIESGVDINVRDYNQKTALMELANKGSGYMSKSDNTATLVEKFIELGARVNVLDNYGNTPIEKASSDAVKKVLKKHKGVRGSAYIKRLIKLVDEKAVPGTDGWRALLELVYNNKASELDESVADQVFGLLAEKATKSSDILLEFPPLSKAVLIYLTGGVNGSDDQGNTVLHLVASESSYKLGEGKADSIKKAAMLSLIEEGADVEILNGQNEPPLYPYLYYINDYSDELVEKLATPKTIDYPLHEPPIANISMRRWNKRQQKEDVAKIDDVMDILMKRKPKLSALKTFHSLCIGGRVDIVKKSVKEGADPIAALGLDGSGLLAAAKGDSVDVIKYLLEELKVSPEAGYEVSGKAPIHETRSIAALDLLIKNGARLDVRTSYQSCLPILTIAERYNVDGPNMVAMMKKLTDLGQSLQERSESGVCAEDLLKKREDPEIQEFLETLK